MNVSYQPAAEGTDADRIIEMMVEFYAHERIPFDEGTARAALGAILRDDRLGRVFLILAGEEVAGYIVLSLGFSMEFHGRYALLDELYVKEGYRRRGIGKKSIGFAEDLCRELGVKALRLEVMRVNTAAQSLYRMVGFMDHERNMMTRWLFTNAGEGNG